MDLNAVFALAASVLGVVFAGLVGRQFLERRKPHQLLWTAGMLLFAIASFNQFYADLVGGWSLGFYRVYYIAAASLVAVMGGGTVYLLRQNKVGHSFIGLLALLSFAFFKGDVAPDTSAGLYWTLALAVSLGLPALLYRLGLRTAGHTFVALVLALDALFVWQLWAQPLNTSLFAEVARAAAGKEVVPGSVRHFAAVLNIAGSAALFLGAIYSWWVMRYGYNLIIAGGTLVFAAGGGLAGLGFPFLLHLSEMVGGGILLYGFIKSREVAGRSTAQPAASTPAEG